MKNKTQLYEEMEDGERGGSSTSLLCGAGKTNHAGVDGAHSPSPFISATPEHIKLSLNEKHKYDCHRKTVDSNW